MESGFFTARTISDFEGSPSNSSDNDAPIATRTRSRMNARRSEASAGGLHLPITPDRTRVSDGGVADSAGVDRRVRGAGNNRRGGSTGGGRRGNVSRRRGLRRFANVLQIPFQGSLPINTSINIQETFEGNLVETFFSHDMRLLNLLRDPSLILYSQNSSSVPLEVTLAESSIPNIQPLSPPTVEVADPLSAFNCAICLESYVRKEPVTTKCGHIFCYECIIQWVHNANFCPKCRKQVNRQSLMRVFP